MEHYWVTEQLLAHKASRMIRREISVTGTLPKSQKTGFHSHQSQKGKFTETQDRLGLVKG